MQTPEAHDSPLPHDEPSSRYLSVGQEKLLPSQTSWTSQRESTAGRQMVPLEAIWH